MLEALVFVLRHFFEDFLEYDSYVTGEIEAQEGGKCVRHYFERKI